MESKHMKRYSTSYLMREIQIKKKYHFGHSIRILEWPKSGTLTIPNSGEECEVIGTFIHHSWKCKIVQLLWKIVWWLFLKKKKTKPPLHRFQQLHSLVLLAQRSWNLCLCKNLHTNVCRSLFIITKIGKHSRCSSVDKWLNV